MTLLLEFGVVVLAAAAAALITLAVIRFPALAGRLDIPNERSSHTKPTPRGGGLSIVCVVSAVIAWAWASRHLDPSFAAALGVGGAAIAAVGWLDDRRPLPAWFRFCVQLIAAIAVVATLGGLPEVSLTTFGARSVTLHLGAAGWAVATLIIVWSTNLYNFMDGIDGLAASEAAAVASIAAWLILPSSEGLRAVCAGTAGASAGFLVWNWSPARTFMGDVGSGYLGFLFGSIALASERVAMHESGAPLVLWACLLALFWVDATVTLLRRVLRGERWYAAHRAHAYQRLTQHGWTHGQVTISAMALNVVILGVVSVSAGRRDLSLAALALCTGVALGGYWWVERRRPMLRVDVRAGA